MNWIKFDLKGGGHTWIRVDAIVAIHESEHEVWIGAVGRGNPIGPIIGRSALDIRNLIGEMTASPVAR